MISDDSEVEGILVRQISEQLNCRKHQGTMT